MKRLKVFLTIVFISVFLLIGVSLSFGDSSDYIYDDAGRLLKVLKGSSMLLYQYDEVGNLLSISTDDGAPNPLPPSLSAIDPDIFIAGLTYNAVITGKNLRTTQSVTSNNPNVIIKNIASIDTKITATISVAGGAMPGQANLTVTTSYGSAVMAVNLYQANIAPGTISLLPASTGSVAVSLTPPAPKDSRAAVINNNPDIINTPSSVAIPAGGIAYLPVTALKVGSGTVEVGSAKATVYVIEGEVASLHTSVSVSFGGLPSGAAVYAQPVSVSIGGSIPESSVVFSNGVSAAWPAFVDSITSAPVSVDMSTLAGATIVSAPVCVKIGQ